MALSEACDGAVKESTQEHDSEVYTTKEDPIPCLNIYRHIECTNSQTRIGWATIKLNQQE